MLNPINQIDSIKVIEAYVSSHLSNVLILCKLNFIKPCINLICSILSLPSNNPTFNIPGVFQDSCRVNLF